MFSDTLAWLLILLLAMPQETHGFYFTRRDIHGVMCSSSFEDQCTMEERSRLQTNTVDMLTRKHQDRVIVIRSFLTSQIRIFNEFFSKTLRTVHMDLDLMFSKTYGSFYQENIQLLNDFFKKIKGFSVSFAETSMKTIVELFFDELFQVMFSIANPFYSITNDQRVCMESFYREIEAFDDIPQKIVNQLSLPLSNWKHFLGSLESLNGILEGYLNITFKEECERGLTRMETCAQCQRISEKPCQAYCVNILSGCTHQMLDSEGAWRAATESMIKLGNQLNHRQNLVSALQPIPVLISEAIMHFQEKRDYITNKMIGKCLLNNEDFGLRKKRSAKFKAFPVITTKRSRDHLILNQMFQSFANKMDEWKVFFGNLPEYLCRGEDWASKEDERCWNGTGVGEYKLPLVNYTNPFSNPEYQGTDFLTFRGNYIEERLRLHWLHSRISHILSGKDSQKSEAYYSHKAEARIQSDDEDYSDYEYESSGNFPGSGSYMSSKREYSPYFRKHDDKIEIVIEPYPVISTSRKHFHSFVIVIFMLFSALFQCSR
ncbi:GlyPicaN [Caenorhabditis elegans]|uniref:GlyPicaN n=1 Tax=Caenorhabditis elegans TaxID=6239 RepID=G5EGU4_CAEEL|nr:GlyPicaN [Caenorhabditis elegans]CAB04542.2 GlyPicaN [Caenorhabditis elegans]|eukprot:NP_510582.1 GlyPicaN [Caenorhabditis elegans]